jgi:hypothetical protein
MTRRLGAEACATPRLQEGGNVNYSLLVEIPGSAGPMAGVISIEDRE